MNQNIKVISECKKIVDLYQKRTGEQKEKNVPLLYKLFYDAVIENKDKLYEKINSTRNVKELSVYMRNGSFAEDAGDDFAAQIFAAMINGEIISDYDGFIKSMYDVLRKYNCNADKFKQFSETWSNQMIQPVMKNVAERRLEIVEIGTGAGSELAKKLHGFLFGKATEITITVILGNSKCGKGAGKAMRKYLGTGESE